MALVYTEFDTDPTLVYAAIKDAVVAGGDWTDISPTPVSTTSTSATATNAATVNLTSVTGLVVGQCIVMEAGTVREERRHIITIAGSTITVNANWSFVHAIGSAFSTSDMILKATTTRGANMIVNLYGGQTQTHGMWGHFYRNFGSTPGSWTDKQDFQLYWKNAAGTATMPIHVTVSASTNHLFVSIEGPRAHETQTTSTTYGSARNYFFISDLVPYHAADTSPVVVAGAVTTVNSIAASSTANSHQALISRNYANTASWTPCRLATLNFPSLFTGGDVLQYQRNCSIDGNAYLFPFVVFDNAEGIRGRLAAPFYAGSTEVSYPTDYPETVGSKVTYDGMKWKLIAPSKGDGSNNYWGPFGATTQSTSVRRSVVVAVPHSTA